MQQLPVESKDYGSYNFLLIHDGEIHLPMYYTDVCGDLSFSDTLSMVTEFSKPEISIKATRRKLLFEIPFRETAVHPIH
jgi:hypothetical protein